MPYSVGEKGSYGCSGYPVIKDDDKTVMGCHDTAQEAGAQIAAIEASEDKGVGIKDPEEWPTKSLTDSNGMPTATGQPHPASTKPSILRKPRPGQNRNGGDTGTAGGAISASETVDEDEVVKADAEITEGDFVIAMTTEGMVVGQVEHVMREGGTYGEPGNPYAVESTPENPAVAIRILEEDDGLYYYTAYSIGARMSDVERINAPSIGTENYKYKSLFADFGKDHTRAQRLTELF